MRKHYHCSLDLACNGDRFDDVISDVLASLSHRDTTGLMGELNPLEPESLVDEPSGMSVVTKRLTDDSGHDWWAIRLQHRDDDSDALYWRTEFALRRTRRSQQALQVSCTVSLGSADDAVLPVHRTASRPRLVQTLVENFGALDGPLPMRPEAIRLGVSDIAVFSQLLFSPLRRRPIVYVSRSVDGSLPLDPSTLASWLVGVAHVVVEEEHYVSHALRPSIGALVAYNGAIRLYWPRVSGADEPYRHPYWPLFRVRELERRRFGFRESMLRRLVDAAVHLESDSRPSYSRVATLDGRMRFEALRGSESESELLTLALDENARFAAERRELERELEEARAEIEDVRAKAAAWEQLYVSLSGTPTHSADDTESEPPPPPIRSVTEALGRSEKMHRGKLVIELNSNSDGDDNHFRKPDKLYDALTFLAEVWRDAKLGIQPCGDFDVALRERCGWRWLGGHSEITTSKYPEWYHATYKNTRHLLDLHIGVGSGKDPTTTMRVGFTWLRDEQLVLVGFIGQHQRTSAT